MIASVDVWTSERVYQRLNAYSHSSMRLGLVEEVSSLMQADVSTHLIFEVLLRLLSEETTVYTVMEQARATEMRKALSLETEVLRAQQDFELLVKQIIGLKEKLEFEQMPEDLIRKTMEQAIHRLVNVLNPRNSLVLIELIRNAELADKQGTSKVIFDEGYILQLVYSSVGDRA